MMGLRGDLSFLDDGHSTSWSTSLGDGSATSSLGNLPGQTDDGLVEGPISNRDPPSDLSSRRDLMP